MKKIHIEIEQNTDEWQKFRTGKLTASIFKRLSKTGKETDGETTLLYEIVGERLAQAKAEPSTFKSGEWGHQYEDFAAQIYEAKHNVKVQKVAFVEKNDYMGCSPDGLILPDSGIIELSKGGLEIKCPVTLANHIRVFDTNTIPDEHVLQIDYQIYICDLDYVDFISYHPVLTGSGFEYIEIRRERTAARMQYIENAANRFIDRVINLEKKLRCV